MEGKSASIGRYRISVRGDELVDEHNPMLGRSKESILPLSAISSIDTTKEQSILAVVASAMLGFIGFGGLANGSTGFGLFFMFLAGASLLWWWGFSKGDGQTTARLTAQG